MRILLKVKFYYEIGETVRFSCSNGQQLSGEQKHNLPLHYGNLGGQNWIIYFKDIQFLILNPVLCFACRDSQAHPTKS